MQICPENVFQLWHEGIFFGARVIIMTFFPRFWKKVLNPLKEFMIEITITIFFKTKP